MQADEVVITTTDQKIDSKTKTYKREVGALLLACIMACGLAGVLGSKDAIEVLKIIIYPFIGFSAAAWGMDAYAKQIKS